MFWVGTVAQAVIIVGRIGHVEGDICRYMDVGNEWVQTFVDSPTGTGDKLSTGAGSRVVLNGTGVNIRININLADHQYLDHAVVIPRRHSRRHRPVVVKNYNTVQDKQKRKERYNYSRQQEIGSRIELKRMDRRERYSMNHSGFTTPSSLSHRRGHL